MAAPAKITAIVFAVAFVDEGQEFQEALSFCNMIFSFSTYCRTRFRFAGRDVECSPALQ